MQISRKPTTPKPRHHIFSFVAAAAACFFSTRQASGATNELVNVALARQGAVAVADSELAGSGAQFAIDGHWLRAGGNPETNRWHGALGKPHPHWVWIRFRAPAAIEQVVLHRADFVDYPADFVGEFSPDGGLTFQTLFTVTNQQMTADEFKVERRFAPVTADNFRLRILRSSYDNAPNSAQLSEVEVLGKFQSEKPERDSRQPAKPLKKNELQPTAARDVEVLQKEGGIEFRSKWLRLACSTRAPRITALCWDSSGEGHLDTNLLKASNEGGATLSYAPLFPERSGTRVGSNVLATLDGNVVRYSITEPGGLTTKWEIRVEPKGFQLAATVNLPKNTLLRSPAGLRFAFDVSQTLVAPLCNPQPGISAPLPCVLHAADFGSLSARSPATGPKLCLVGDSDPSGAQWNAMIGQVNEGRTSDGFFVPPADLHLRLDFEVASFAPVPALIQADPRLRNLPRSWLNTFQYRTDLGVLANNVVSDNAVFCMFTFTDPAVFTPPLSDGIEVIQLARESLDRYFSGTRGYGMGIEDIMTDTYPSLIISAWDVIRVTGDRKLLQRWLPKLEEMATKAIAQDHNGNGLPESTRTGVAGDVPHPPANWWDQINFGHEDAYSAALAYRAFHCLADVEKLAGRSEKEKRYEERANKIQNAFVTNFFNPKTGVLAGWKDKNGELHDYWFVFVNGMAITYGLVPKPLANQIVDRFQAKMREVNYTRFDLGLPGNLVPVPKRDYGRGTLGSPATDDGTDTFGVFENGGATACYAYFYIQALYQLGRTEEAEQILWPMLRTFASGGFQNGIGHGGEWRYWDGRPSGYEGFLADAYYAQLALLTGHYGIAFGPNGFMLEPWSPLQGQRVPLGLKFMGKTVKELP